MCIIYLFYRLSNAYHGGSPFIMDVTCIGNWKFPLPRPLGSHAVAYMYMCCIIDIMENLFSPQTINPDVYRGPWGGAKCRDSKAQAQRKCNCSDEVCNASMMYADQLEDLLIHSCHKKIAGFIAEPIQVMVYSTTCSQAGSRV